MKKKNNKVTIKIELDREDYEWAKKEALKDPKFFSKLLRRGYSNMGGVF